MKKGKTLTTKQRWLYYLLIILAGGFFGGIGLAFLVEAYHGYKNAGGDLLGLEDLLMGTRILAIVLLMVTGYDFYAANRYHLFYEKSDQEEEEQTDYLYVTIFKYLEYGTIFFNVAAAIILFNIVAGMRLSYSSDSAGAIFSIFDFSMLILLIVGQVIYAKLVGRIRQYKLSAFPTGGEIKEFIYSYDEAERQANFEQSFLIVFNLNQHILPILYVVIFTVSTILQSQQVLAYLVVVCIHIYINIAQFQMVRKFFK